LHHPNNFTSIFKVDTDAQILVADKVLPDATKVEPFDGNNFKRWQQKVLSVFDLTKISSALIDLDHMRNPKNNPKN
jgi:hypothetical protein